MRFLHFLPNSATTGIKDAPISESLRIRNEIGEWNDDQERDFRGFIKKPYGKYPFESYILGLPKTSHIYRDVSIFGRCDILVDQITFDILQELTMPKFECWKIVVQIKSKKVIENYFLIHFYYNYFNDIDFANSKINLYEDMFSPKIIEENYKIATLEEWLSFFINRKKNGTEPYLKIDGLFFDKQLYNLDLIPINYQNYVSERLIIRLNEKGINDFTYQETSHIIYP